MVYWILWMFVIAGMYSSHKAGRGLFGPFMFHDRYAETSNIRTNQHESDGFYGMQILIYIIMALRS